MEGILFSAYQKFYSALCSLERFNKEKDFFENIANLDNFFAEFRNITFVLQKSVADTEFDIVYIKKRDEHLQDCKWFINKRNEVTKQAPFQLVKQIDINIYSPYQGVHVVNKQFSVQDDVELSSLLDDLKIFFKEFVEIEIFFSVEFSFYEKNSKEDLFEKLLDGINSMSNFLDAMEVEIKDECKLCKELKEKISKKKIALLPKDLLFINDYIYYPKDDEFERAGRMTMMIGNNILKQRMDISAWGNAFFPNEKDFFKKFVAMHAIMGSVDLMNVICVVYLDDTFIMDVFVSDIKTTMYRKIYEISEHILTGDIKEIYLMATYTVNLNNFENMSITSKERLEKSIEDCLVFMKVDSNLNEEEYFFEGSKIRDMEYIKCKLCHGCSNVLQFGRLNMNPIKEAFTKIAELK